MDIKQYAPVYIPTLNRFEHFKRCLESLEKCTGADKTEVYVGLDYPPSGKYVEGWKKIDEYLKIKEKDNRFARLEVHRREQNCGVLNRNSNSALLRRYIRERYSRFIFSEDDNVFSPNFLVYINQGLEKYESDPNCLNVCGYNYFGVNISSDSNVYLSREYSAWGAGFWTNKLDEITKITNLDYLRSITKSPRKWWTIYKHEPRLLNTIMLNLQANRVFGDTVRVSYQYLEDKYSVFPTISKVRNIGFDNSGTTIFKEDDNYNKQVIDENASFEIDEIESRVLPSTQKEVEKFFKRSVAMNILVLVRMVIFNLTGIDICLREIKRRNKTLFK